MSKIKSPLSWVGGKSRMVHKLLPLIPEHKTYVEVFGGQVIYYSVKSLLK